MNTIYICIVCLFLCTQAFAKVWTITAQGSSFTPSSITIAEGDSVRFTLSQSHDAVEVSKATYDLNGNTSNGGFKKPLGGGLVLPAQLANGNHYYVCTPHAALGMKGMITVNTISTNIQSKDNLNHDVNAFPNPFQNTITIPTLNADKIQIYTLTEKIYRTIDIDNTTTSIKLQTSDLVNGIYFYAIIKENVILKSIKIIKN